MAAALLFVGCSTGAEIGDGTPFTPSGGGQGTDTDDESESEGSDGDSRPATTSNTPEPPLPPHPEPSSTGDSGSTGDFGSTGDSGSTTDEPLPGTTGEQTEDCAFVLLTHLNGQPLNVRSTPSIGAALVGTMLEGQVVDVLAEVVGQPVNIPPLGVSDVWLEVDDGVVQGFVTSLYTECMG